MSAPARIVHLISGDRWAGAEVATAHLLGALARRGDLALAAVVLNDGELARAVRERGVPVQVVSEAGRGALALRRDVARALARADLVHAHRYKEDLLAATSGRPWVATQHGRPEPFTGLRAARMALYTALDLAARRLSARRSIAVSREVEAWLAGRVGARRVVRVWNGIEDPAPRVRPAPWPQRPAVVGAVARLDPVKGLELAIDAVAQVPGLELELVGEGGDRARLERRAAESGAGARIRFYGFEADPLPRLGRWRALLLPSLHEGNPISVLEALALGTPVVAADLAGVAEILDGSGGWRIARRDPEAWAAALAPIAAGAPEAERVAREGRGRYLEAFTADHAAAAIAEVYAAVLAELRPPRAA